MRLLAFCLSVFLVMPLAAQAQQRASGSVEGYWLTENKRAVVHLVECPKGLCGTVHWLIADAMQFDSKNPDESKRRTPMCGLSLLWGFEKVSAAEWENGNIYKADEGEVYSADIELQADGTLRLRGYLGIPMFGKTQVWSRVSPKDYARCKPAA